VLANLYDTALPSMMMHDVFDRFLGFPAADKLARGERNPQAAKCAAQRMDRRREENSKLFGVQNIGVDIIRQMRDCR
jgi:hypothetical protein